MQYEIINAAGITLRYTFSITYIHVIGLGFFDIDVYMYDT